MILNKLEIIFVSCITDHLNFIKFGGFVAVIKTCFDTFSFVMQSEKNLTESYHTRLNTNYHQGADVHDLFQLEKCIVVKYYVT